MLKCQCKCSHWPNPHAFFLRKPFRNTREVCVFELWKLGTTGARFELREKNRHFECKAQDLRTVGNKPVNKQQHFKCNLSVETALEWTPASYFQTSCFSSSLLSAKKLCQASPALHASVSSCTKVSVVSPVFPLVHCSTSLKHKVHCPKPKSISCF